MTIDERIVAKRNELEAAIQEANRLWPIMLKAEKEFQAKFQKPWFDASERQDSLSRELRVLEGIKKEMQPQ